MYKFNVHVPVQLVMTTLVVFICDRTFISNEKPDSTYCFPILFIHIRTQNYAQIAWFTKLVLILFSNMCRFQFSHPLFRNTVTYKTKISEPKAFFSYFCNGN